MKLAAAFGILAPLGFAGTVPDHLEAEDMIVDTIIDRWPLAENELIRRALRVGKRVFAETYDLHSAIAAACAVMEGVS